MTQMRILPLRGTHQELAWPLLFLSCLIRKLYNRKRLHSHLNQLSPMDFEKLQIGTGESSSKAGEVQHYQNMKSTFSVIMLLLLMLCHCLTAIAKQEPFIDEDIDRLIDKSCSSEFPNTKDQHKTAERTVVNWDSRSIRVINSYQVWLSKGVSQLKPGMTIGGNTPINAERSVLSLGFYFPSLRGTNDPTFKEDRRNFYSKYKVDRKKSQNIPESLITVTVDYVKDWSKVPQTQETEFWKTFYKPNLTPLQIEKARTHNLDYFQSMKVIPGGEIKYVKNYQLFGLKEFVSRRTGMFYYEPVDSKEMSPYNLPRFNCDAVGRIGVVGCVGHFKMDHDYLVTYQIPYKLMQCWQKVEEGVRRVVRLNTQTTSF